MDHPIIKYLPSFIRTRIGGHYILQKTISNTGWLFVDKVIRLGVGLFVSVWVARYLGPEKFGILSYAIAYVALFTAFAKLGLDSVVVRNIVRDPSHKEEILGTAFILKIIGGVLTLLLTVGVISLIRPDEVLTRWLVGIIAAGMTFQAFDTIDFWFQSQIQSKYTVYAKNGSFLVISMVKVALIFLNAPLIAFAWAGLAEVILGSIGLVIVYKVKGYYLKAWSSNLIQVRNLLKDSWPLILSGLLIMIYMRIDQVMLGELTTNKDVGIYSASVYLVEFWYFIPMAITVSVFPVIVESKSLGKNIYDLRMQRLYDLMVWMAVIVALLVSIFSQQIIEMLYGNKYNGAAPVLAIQAWMTTMMFFNVARGKWLLSEGRMKDIMLLNSIAALLNIAGNYFLIPLYGAVGASVASLITAFGANLLVAISSQVVRFSMKMYLTSLLLPLRLIIKSKS